MEGNTIIIGSGKTNTAKMIYNTNTNVLNTFFNGNTNNTLSITSGTVGINISNTNGSGIPNTAYALQIGQILASNNIFTVDTSGNCLMNGVLQPGGTGNCSFIK